VPLGSCNIINLSCHLFSYASNLKNDDVSKLVETLPELKHLRISCCPKITAELLTTIPERVKVDATFINTPPQDEFFFTPPTHDKIFRTIASYPSLCKLSPFPQEEGLSTTEHFKERSFENILNQYWKK